MPKFAIQTGLQFWRLVAVASFGGLALCVFTGQGAQQHSPKTLRAERFELVDATGQVRGLFKYEKNEASLHLLGRGNVVMGSNATGPYVSIWDSGGHLRSIMELDKNEQPHIYLADANDTLRLAIALIDSDPHVDLMDGNKKSRVTLQVDKGDPRVIIWSAETPVKPIWAAPK